MAKESNYDERLEQFVKAQEQELNNNKETQKPQTLKEQADAHLKERKDVPLQKAQEYAQQEISEENRRMGMGFIPVPVESLPTRGMFYPEGTKLMIRAASGREISHWSMTNETELTEVDDALNYMLERCVTVKFPEGYPVASYKDLKEIDRFYMILSVRDITFTEGNNELKVQITEDKEQVVHKDNIEFIKLDDKLMQHYDEQNRCFVFKTKMAKTPYLNIYMPSVGVTQWLKKYIQKKSQAQQGFDQDFVTIAPMLIKDWRGLTDAAYEKYLVSTYDFGIYEFSLLAKIKGLLQDSISPVLKYVDEDGAEQTSPLNFRGGIKSIFLLDLDDVL